GRLLRLEPVPPASAPLCARLAGCTSPNGRCALGRAPQDPAPACSSLPHGRLGGDSAVSSSCARSRSAPAPERLLAHRLPVAGTHWAGTPRRRVRTICLNPWDEADLCALFAELPSWRCLPIAPIVLAESTPSEQGLAKICGQKAASLGTIQVQVG